MYTNGLDETAIQFYSRAGGRNVAGATHAMTIGGYELGEEIGRGGMSVVYRAVRKTDGAPVAVKVFDVPAGPCREELARKFVQETKLLSVLDHPISSRFSTRALPMMAGHGSRWSWWKAFLTEEVSV